MRKMKSSNAEKPQHFNGWHTKAAFVLSVQRPGVVEVKEAQGTSAEEPDGGGEEEADTQLSRLHRWCSNSCFAVRCALLGGTFSQRQTAFNRDDQDMCIILW